MRCEDVPGSEVALPTLNVEDADVKDGGGGGQGSRRPSKLATEETVAEPCLVADVAQLAASALQQLEPEVDDTQLAEVSSPLHHLTSTLAAVSVERRFAVCLSVCSISFLTLTRQLQQPDIGIRLLVVPNVEAEYKISQNSRFLHTTDHRIS